MRTSEIASNLKEAEVQYGETSSIASRPSVSASGSRGTFSCRRWRLLSGKPSKDDAALGARVTAHKPSLGAVTPGTVRRPTTTALDSDNWATAATPFAAFLPRDTIVPTTSRKSVAAAVLTSAFPPENAKKFDRELTICERKHVKAMGRMATRIYRGKSEAEEPSEPAKRRLKTREKQTLKDHIYLPVLCEARTGGLRDLSPPRASKLLHPSPGREESPQDTVAIPDALAGMKLLSSQLDELRAGLEISATSHEVPGRTDLLWYPQSQRSTKRTLSQTPNVAGRMLGHTQDTGSSSSSIETLLLRVLERPPASSDGYQTDHEESSMESSDGIKTKFLASRSTNNSEDDLLLLLSALDSTSQIPSQDETSHPSTSTKSLPDSIMKSHPILPGTEQFGGEPLLEPNEVRRAR
ncbi:hypothetical protein PHYPSEUDO_007566 [Phytophthora pseudosyringae]|uniref:Uncharacterized protein n=1 Tax=Phytophthora pseudosyringae TaxID=221518 RepID=A0A8T1VJB7_9STRA|nr:hypothetical protein PHYPSEUDO_007566 [Phytophthora pseudosyringae]